MQHEINIEEFSTRVRTMRGKRGLREVAQEIGEVSASTLSRIENGNIPDLDTFVRICRWLGTSPNMFFRGETSDDESSVENESSSKKSLIKAHLRADRTLDPKTAEALVRMIELAYEQAERDGINDE